MSNAPMDRRGFLKTRGAAAAGVAAASTGTVALSFSVSAWAGELKNLSAHEGKTLLKVTRQIFPHPSLADVYYAGVVDTLDAEAGGNAETANLIKQGVAALDAATKLKWLELSDGYQLEILRSMESSAMFQKAKGTAVVALYNNPLVWRHFGYEGPSAQYGGYINRGFNDLRWLGDPPEDASPKVG